MPYNTKIVTSLHGRRFGLQPMSSVENGGKGPLEFLVGPDAHRMGVATDETTASGVGAAGISWLLGTSVASTPVYVLDPPIPGVDKTIHFGSSDSKIWVRTKNGEIIRSSGASTGATFTALTSSAGGTVRLTGLTTAIWLLQYLSTLGGVSGAATT
jgi:hypothetical protein